MKDFLLTLVTDALPSNVSPPPCFYLYIINIFRISIQILRSMHISSVPLLAYLSPTVKKTYILEKSKVVMYIVYYLNLLEGSKYQKKIKFRCWYSFSYLPTYAWAKTSVIWWHFNIHLQQHFSSPPPPILNLILSITQIIFFPYSGIIF